MVKGGDFGMRCHEFESQHYILDGEFLTFTCQKLYLDQKQVKKMPGWPIYKTQRCFKPAKKVLR